jgi:GNAT superfamily N-acetyltransferase
MHIRQMTTADIALGMGLKGQAGWNQTEADWRRFLHLEPKGCFVAELDGRGVGTTTTCVFDTVGWIAMVLVDTAQRHQGTGTRLVEHAISHLDQHGVSAIRLDATPLGRPIYERLGFVAQYDLFRWQGTAVSAPAGEAVVQVTSGHLDGICELDHRVIGVDRRRLLTRLVGERPEMAAAVLQGESVAGYAMVRPGSRAWQIGPAASLRSEAGSALADWAFNRCAGGEVFVDIPADNEPASRWAASKGLTQQRVLTRMCRGQAICDRVSELWASSGPEKG